LNRRHFIKQAGLGAFCLAGTESLSPLSAAPRRPGSVPASKTPQLNFILINVDDLGWADLTCYGSKFYETPNIDRLASQGIRFTDAYASCALCSPTRAALMTGRYPARIGITDFIHQSDREALTAVGKGENPKEYVGKPSQKLLCPPNPYWMDLDEKTIAEMLKPDGYTSCHIGKWHLGHYWWYPEKQGFDINIGGADLGQPPSYFDPYYENSQRSSIPSLPPQKQGEYLTDREADEAVRFIRNHWNRPFFLNMCHYAVHAPLQAKEEMVFKYKNKVPTKQKNAVYAAMIESVDQAVGRILDTLEELDLADRTIVFFTSDNGGLQGPSTDNSPLRSGKGYPYEGGIRVPLIVRWPGRIKPGSQTAEPVSSIDLFPTILEAAGTALPEDRTIDGQSLVPVLHRQESLGRDALFWHFPHYRGWGGVVPYSIVLSQGWKLIKHYEEPSYELFHIAEDIGETREISATHQDKVKELDSLLTEWINHTGAKLPRPNKGYRPSR
jgi:arylsulfatase A